jgi:hypothetical protein
MRLGRTQDAFRVYEEAVELGLFPSVYQRSTYNLDGLAARPWWTLSQTRCSKHLKVKNRENFPLGKKQSKKPCFTVFFAKLTIL